MTRLFLSPPHMCGKELELVQEAFAANYIAPTGAMLDMFEKKFTEYTGIPHATAVSSCTAALHLALRMIDVGQGDSIYFSSLTFIGGVVSALYQGAKPVFLDSSASSWNMDPELLDEALKSDAKTGTLPKAVIPTDIYGQSCDLDAIISVCSQYNIPVITDCAESLGGKYKGRHCGDGALISAFSFNGNKIITTSGGGMLASSDKNLVERAHFLAHQARDNAPHYEHTTFGYNYRMSNIVAAIGCGQMEALADRVKRRREIFDTYEKGLSDIPGISFMPEAPYGECTRWLTVILIDPKEFGSSYEDVRIALEKENIESRPVWKPMHLQPVFKDARFVGNGVSEHLFKHGLCLPSGTQMTESDIQRVMDTVRNQHKTAHKIRA